MSGFCACGVVVMVLWFLEFAGAMHHSLPEVPGLTAASVDEDRPELPSVEGELPAAEGELPAVEGELPAAEGELPAVEGELPAAAVETPEPPAAAVDEDRPAAALDEERPELVEERPVPPESAAAAPSSSSESTEAERRRRRRRRRAADRREEAMLRILVELQAQTRTMHDNHRELMDRVLSLASQTAQTATAERSTARRAPRARCNTCVACTVAPPPGTRRAPCESWRTSAAPSTPAPGSAPKTPRGADGRFIRVPLEALTSTGEESPTPRLPRPEPDQELDDLFVDDDIPASLEGEKKKKKKDKKRRRLLPEPSDKDRGDGHGGPGHDGDGHGGPGHDGDGHGAPVEVGNYTFRA